MSVHREDGGWKVRWRERCGDGSWRQRGRMFVLKGDADDADREIRRRKRLGLELSSLFLDQAGMTLAEFVATGFRMHAVTRATKTREQYRWALDLHLQELLDLPLAALTIPRLAEHQAFLLENGRTPHTVRTVMTLLSGILQIAVDHGHLPMGNPARQLRKVPADLTDEIVPLSPVELEAVIASLKGRGRIISVLAGHLGLSPIEVRLAPWTALNDDMTKFTVGAAQTKRQRAHTRVLDVPHHTRAELRAWRLESGGRGNTPLIGPISVPAMKVWGTRTLKPRIEAVTDGRVDGSLYTLRHTHASLLHYCGFAPAAAAKRMGHSVAMHWRHYAHVVEALEGRGKFADLDELIATARAELAKPAALRKGV